VVDFLRAGHTYQVLFRLDSWQAGHNVLIFPVLPTLTARNHAATSSTLQPQRLF